MNPSDGIGDRLLDLLARWQAFSVLQQRAFTFLAAEAIATGAEFERSAEGAALVLSRIGTATTTEETQSIRDETFSVVHRLQGVDRSRQGLEQVASVLETLRRLEADLSEETRALPPLPAVEPHIAAWIGLMSDGVTLSDWRRRFFEVLNGREPGPRPAAAHADSPCDDELF